MRLLDLPLPAGLLRKRIYPGEFYPFWEHFCPGFSEPCRDLVKEDVTIAVKEKATVILGGMLTAKRDRLLIKITGWPRMGFLKEIFPDAKFIHIFRDGRSVANSWLQLDWWSGWGGPERWRWGGLSEEQRQKWDHSGRSFIVLAALGWEILMRAFAEAERSLPDGDVLRIPYEGLCREPGLWFRRAAEFAEMEWPAKLEEIVGRFPWHCADDKWRHDLTGAQQQMLIEALACTSKRYGYE
jgi:hypothetical protein